MSLHVVESDSSENERLLLLKFSHPGDDTGGRDIVIVTVRIHCRHDRERIRCRQEADLVRPPIKAEVLLVAEQVETASKKIRVRLTQKGFDPRLRYVERRSSCHFVVF